MEIQPVSCTSPTTRHLALTTEPICPVGGTAVFSLKRGLAVLIQSQFRYLQPKKNTQSILSISRAICQNSSLGITSEETLIRISRVYCCLSHLIYKMKSFSGAVALLSLAATEVSAHYIFNSLAVDNSKPSHEHVRYNTNYNSPVTCKLASFLSRQVLLRAAQRLMINSQTALASNDLRCNVGGATAGNTTTIDVKAGDAFTFGTDTPVYHQGPISL